MNALKILMVLISFFNSVSFAYSSCSAAFTEILATQTPSEWTHALTEFWKTFPPTEHDLNLLAKSPSPINPADLPHMRGRPEFDAFRRLFSELIAQQPEGWAEVREVSSNRQKVETATAVDRKQSKDEVVGRFQFSRKAEPSKLAKHFRTNDLTEFPSIDLKAKGVWVLSADARPEFKPAPEGFSLKDVSMIYYENKPQNIVWFLNKSSTKLWVLDQQTKQEHIIPINEIMSSDIRKVYRTLKGEIRLILSNRLHSKERIYDSKSLKDPFENKYLKGTEYAEYHLGKDGCLYSVRIARGQAQWMNLDTFEKYAVKNIALNAFRLGKQNYPVFRVAEVENGNLTFLRVNEGELHLVAGGGVYKRIVYVRLEITQASDVRQTLKADIAEGQVNFNLFKFEPSGESFYLFTKSDGGAPTLVIHDLKTAKELELPLPPDSPLLIRDNTQALSYTGPNGEPRLLFIPYEARSNFFLADLNLGTGEMNVHPRELFDIKDPKNPEPVGIYKNESNEIVLMLSHPRKGYLEYVIYGE